jgi:hypothetical protein
MIVVSAPDGLALNGGGIDVANHSESPDSLGYYKIIQYTGDIQGAGLESLVLPPESIDGIVYHLDVLHDPGFIDLHRGYLGDANDDGIVEFADFVALANNFGASNAGWSGGDLNNDGTTNFADFVILANHFGGTMATPGAVSGVPDTAMLIASGLGVPEPGTLALMAGGVAFLSARRRRTK